MKNWFTSKAGVIGLNIIALINFIARSLLDWRYVYPDMFSIDSDPMIVAGVLYLVILAVWFWALVAAAQGGRGALVVLMVFNLIFLFGTGWGTYQYFCPSPCLSLWPVGEILNWSNMVFGLLTPFATGLHLWSARKQPERTASARVSE